MTLVIAGNCYDGIAMICDAESLLLEPASLWQDENTPVDLLNVAIGIPIMSTSPLGRSVSARLRSMNKRRRSYTNVISVILSAIRDLRKDSTLNNMNSAIIVARGFQSSCEFCLIDNHGKTSNIDDWRAVGDDTALSFPFLDKYGSSKMTVLRFIELGFFILKFIDHYYSKAISHSESRHPQVVFFSKNGEGLESERQTFDAERLAKVTTKRFENYLKDHFKALDPIFT